MPLSTSFGKLGNPFDVSEEPADIEAQRIEAKGHALLMPPKHPFFSVRMDGPFGAPAQDYSKHKVLLLVVSFIRRTLCHKVNRKQGIGCLDKKMVLLS